MRKMMKSKTAIWENLSAMTLGIVTFVVLAAVGGLILASIGSNATVAADPNATTIVNYGKTGVVSLTSWTPVIIVVAVGAILISLVAGFFMRKAA